VTDAKEFKSRFGFAPIADRQFDAAVDGPGTAWLG
jgi:hypothetical protein